MKTKTATATQFFEPQSSATTNLQTQPQWGSISEKESTFLALFPHRFDYLWAAHPDPGERPDWKTESRHPLSDRLLQQGAYLYGVRFGKLTRYCVLDVDRHSAFHPTRDPFAIKRMAAALEVIGLVSHVAVTSSYSGGLHLYFPFAEEQKSWAIALVVSTLLEQAGFKLKPGQLEIFPNPRPYTSGTPSLYNGHRVPIQAGSYLLNDHWEQVYSDQATFVRQWRWAEGRNDLHCKTIERVLKQTQRQAYKNVKGGGQKFLNDLHTEIELGWTGAGQTNRLLGRIAMREYIFGHVLRGGEPLMGQALAEAIVEVAVALPGYEEWCRHKHELYQRALAWARDIEAAPNYYPYDPSKRSKAVSQLETPPQNNIVSFNQKSALDAEQRIKAAIATLQATNNFPSGTTARADAIVPLARCSKQTLNKHKALWHPDYIGTECPQLTEPVTAPSDSLPVAPLATVEPLLEGSVHSIQSNKFVAHPAAPSEQAEQLQEVGGSGGVSTGQVLQAVATAAELNNAALKTQDLITSQVETLPLVSQKATTAPTSVPTKQADLAVIGESNPATPDATVGTAALTPTQAEKSRQRQHREQAYAAKMQIWLVSSDPILVKEAQAWYAQQRFDSCSEAAPTLPVHRPSETLALPASPVRTPLDEQQALDSKTCSTLPLVIESVVCDRTDLSDVLAAIAVQRARLGWSGQAFYDYCLATFGQALALLDDEAVVGLLVSLQLLDFKFDQDDEGSFEMSDRRV